STSWRYAGAGGRLVVTGTRTGVEAHPARSEVAASSDHGIGASLASALGGPFCGSLAQLIDFLGEGTLSLLRFAVGVLQRLDRRPRRRREMVGGFEFEIELVDLGVQRRRIALLLGGDKTAVIADAIEAEQRQHRAEPEQPAPAAAENPCDHAAGSGMR